VPNGVKVIFGYFCSLTFWLTIVLSGVHAQITKPMKGIGAMIDQKITL
jgi:hypothetical protein